MLNVTNTGSNGHFWLIWGKMTTTIAINALLHAVPIFFVAFMFQSKSSVRTTALVMAIVAVAKGGFQYVLLDLIVVLVAYAYAFDRWCMGSPPTTDVPSTNIQSVPPIQSDGDVAQWHENGQKEIEGNYVNDENEDLWPDEDPLIDEDPLTDEDLLTDEDPLACWYENGQKQVEDKFVNGEMVSTTCWYENGQKQAEGHYVNGKPDGIANEWYKNGQKKTEQKFVNGELVLTTWWNKNGQKNAECNHLKGKVVPGSYKEWDENGNLKR